LLESRKSIIASYGRPLSRPELDSIQDPRTVRLPVISDTINNRLLVNFCYDLYAYYPDNEQESKWECLTHSSKLGTPTICFRRPALVFDHIVYFYFPKQENSPYCIDAYDLTTNKPINVLWSADFRTDVYNDSLAQLARLDRFGYDTSRITLAHLGDGIMCLASCSQDDNSCTCLHFLRFRVQRLASLEEGVLITPVTAHQFTLPTCYRRIGSVIPL
ncbi:hypothetical protein A2U01_0030362, partial [Trifolium medium]|nr:hypothetical protein [Trifolium medium]